LPFARILHEARQIRVSDAYRRMVIAGACALMAGQQERLYLNNIKGLSAHDLNVIVRAFQQLVLDIEDRPYTGSLGPPEAAPKPRAKLETAGGFRIGQRVISKALGITLRGLPDPSVPVMDEAFSAACNDAAIADLWDEANPGNRDHTTPGYLRSVLLEEAPALAAEGFLPRSWRVEA